MFTVPAYKGLDVEEPQVALTKDDEKRELYSKNACHELSFFLMKKDPEFFKSIIQPYLKNKKDKTFVDHFLLEDDLTGYLKPWAYGQLNIVERILLIQRIQNEGPNGARHVRENRALIGVRTDTPPPAPACAASSGYAAMITGCFEWNLVRSFVFFKRCVRLSPSWQFQ